MSEMKEFYLTDFFELAQKGMSFSSEIGEFPVVKAQTDNWGRAGNEFGQATMDKGITLGMRGSFNAYVQTTPVILENNVTGFVPKELDMSNEIMLYFATLIAKPYAHSEAYRGYPTLTKLKEEPVTLPVTPDGNVNYDEMERVIKQVEDDYVKQVEDDYVKQVEAYLESNGFSTLADTELMDVDKAVLRRHESAVLKEFRVGDLFEIRTGSLISAEELIPGSVPRVSAKTTNNGVIGYYSDLLNDELTMAENFIAVTFMGDVTYHQELSSVEMKVHILQNEHMNEKIGLYLATAIKKSIAGKYSRAGEQLSSSKLKNDDITIFVPVTSDGDVNYDEMERVIKISKKNVIRKLRADMDTQVKLLSDVK